MSEEMCMVPSVPLAMEETFTHWSRLVEITFGDERVVAVEQDPDSFVLGTTVWDSSKTLLKYVEQHASVFQRYTSICELGAGAGGLAGIAVAINNNGLSDVVMTDIGPVLPWLRKNVRANLTDKEAERVRIEQHAWYVLPLCSSARSVHWFTRAWVSVRLQGHASDEPERTIRYVSHYTMSRSSNHRYLRLRMWLQTASCVQTCCTRRTVCGRSCSRSSRFRTARR